jgi:hypothetical protein
MDSAYSSWFKSQRVYFPSPFIGYISSKDGFPLSLTDAVGNITEYIPITGWTVVIIRLLVDGIVTPSCQYLPPCAPSASICTVFLLSPFHLDT